MIRVAICVEGKKEEAQFGCLLEKVCKNLLVDLKIDFFRKRELLLESFDEVDYQLIYLYLAGGIKETMEIVLKVRNKWTNGIIALESEYSCYIRELCDMDPIVYVKSSNRRNKSLELPARNKFASKSNGFYSYRYMRKMYSVNISEILFFESCGRKIYIHKKDKSADCFFKQLDEVEKELESAGQKFLRCHQSYLVNSCAIREIDASEIVLTSGETVPVSRRRKGLFQEEYNAIMKQKIL